MSDPVLLTTSGNTVDRSTIVRHLLRLVYTSLLYQFIPVYYTSQ